MIIDDKVYGKQHITDPLIIELLESIEVKRLKGIRQNGAWWILDRKFRTTRFEHSFGVYWLLKHFGASEDEQVAGLLHDVNHTAFSHVVDYVLGDPETQDFSDARHRDIILSSSIPSILKRYDLDAYKISDHHSFGLLDNEIPDICCDRLDYCLRDSICCGFVNRQGAAEILDGLVVHDGEIVCKDEKSALRIARLFLRISRFLWSNELQAGSYLLLAEALKVAVKEKIISIDDFYSNDATLLKSLKGSGNKTILDLLGNIRIDAIVPGSKDDHDFFAKSKARFIDPKFLDGNGTRRLSEADRAFKKEIENFRDRVKSGFYIKLIK